MNNKLLLIFIPFFQLLHAQTDRYAVVIHEIMADPTPVIGLPNTEYIELRNTSTQPVHLLKWKIDNGTTTATITIPYVLQPDSVVVLCARTQIAQFGNLTNIIGLTSFPAISNDGDLLTLKSADNTTIHAVAFETNWYNSTIKSNGGWSLEMIDVSQPCAKGNWSASTHSKGGTPGLMNSINGRLDYIEPAQLLQCTAIGSDKLLLQFDSPFDSLSLSNTQRYAFSVSDELHITKAISLPPLFNEVEIYLNNKMDSNRMYRLLINNVQQCDKLSSNNYTIQTGIPKKATKGDLVFNELLFDPEPGGADFIEVINTSSAIINAKNILLGNRNSDGAVNSSTHVFANNFNLFPFEAFVFTTDTSYLLKKWKSAERNRLLFMQTLPSMPDDNGNLLLLDASGTILDEVTYDKNMHYPLLRNKEGVSLEKINYRLPSQQKDNWHSAAASFQYATPTQVNSQYTTQEESTTWITIHQDVLQPDNDGQADFLQINYQFKEPGTLLSVHLFNQQGIKIATIINNQLCGIKGSYHWKGVDNQNSYVSTGVYIIVAEAFHLNGFKQRFKKVVAIKRA